MPPKIAAQTTQPVLLELSIESCSNPYPLVLRSGENIPHNFFSSSPASSPAGVGQLP